MMYLLSKEEKLQRMICSYIRKWLEAPCCLSRVNVFGKGILELPITSLTEEFKYAKARLEMTLARNTAVQSTAAVSAGRKWNLKEAVLQAQVEPRHRNIIGQVLHGCGGVWSGYYSAYMDQSNSSWQVETGFRRDSKGKRMLIYVQESLEESMGHESKQD